ncbi:26338_t:CDS:2 [Dentiscutata erythropus]|uniref:26338_t:CDS:1 n=1 Tax=Dentiscutata erythropus TaxID=1348616 RepID=A0A9N8WEB7_9GLOM|nr:26338_t:CDS:2 [Dentiscutata erythropus]
MEVYLDDIIIYSKTFQDHLNHLKNVLTTLAVAVLKLNPDKYELFKNNIEFLGHEVGKARITPDENKA